MEQDSKKTEPYKGARESPDKMTKTALKTLPFLTKMAEIVKNDSQNFLVELKKIKLATKAKTSPGLSAWFPGTLTFLAKMAKIVKNDSHNFLVEL